MRFRTATRNASYTILPFDQARDSIGRVIQKVPGLRAEFVGPEHIFDSEEAQRRHGWTDEQRLDVERHLLSHKHFGRMRVFDLGGTSPETQRGNAVMPELYFAPGQTLPDEHREFCMAQRWWQIEEAAGEHPEPESEPEVETRVCMYRALNEDNEVVSCERTAEAGHDYCAEHYEIVAASLASSTA